MALPPAPAYMPQLAPIPSLQPQQLQQPRQPLYQSPGPLTTVAGASLWTNPGPTLTGGPAPQPASIWTAQSPAPRSASPGPRGRGAAKTAARRRTSQGSPQAAQGRRQPDDRPLSSKTTCWGLLPTYFKVQLVASLGESEFNFMSLSHCSEEHLSKLLFLCVSKQPGDRFEAVLQDKNICLQACIARNL